MDITLASNLNIFDQNDTQFTRGTFKPNDQTDCFVTYVSFVYASKKECNKTKNINSIQQKRQYPSLKALCNNSVVKYANVLYRQYIYNIAQNIYEVLYYVHHKRNYSKRDFDEKYWD